MSRQRSRRPAPVADRVLLGGAELGHGAIVARRGVVRDEGGVVAEASAPARPLCERSLAATLEQALSRAVDQGDRADVGEPAVLGAFQLPQQLRQVLLVGRVLARVPSGSNTR